MAESLDPPSGLTTTLPNLLSMVNLHRRCRQLGEALKLARLAASIAPSDVNVLTLLGMVLWENDQLMDAESILRRAHGLDVQNPNSALNLGNFLLAKGYWDEGLVLWERRHDKGFEEQFGSAPKVSFKKWNGESLWGKSILIWPEQGHGDQIQLVRYVRKLRAFGVKRITLVCWEALVPLFASLPGIDATVTPGVYYAMGCPKHDFWTFIYSIPSNFRDRQDLLPAEIPYLRGKKKIIEKYQSIFRGRGKRIGLAWKGSPHNPVDSTRSLPGLDAFKPFSGGHGLTFVGLNRQDESGEAEGWAKEHGVLCVGDSVRDFAELAAVISYLDLIISVDTAVAHLAAAMGKPTWILLPNVFRDWRWNNEGSESVWYPGVVTLFRQRTLEADWSATIQRVADALSKI